MEAAVRATPGAEAEHVAGHERPGPDLRQHVRGTTPEYRCDVEAAVDGQVGAQAVANRADGKDLAGGDRERRCPTGADTVDRRLGVAHHGDMRRRR